LSVERGGKERCCRHERNDDTSFNKHVAPFLTEVPQVETGLQPPAPAKYDNRQSYRLNLPA
jgi:hypothetical protein